MRYCPGLFSMSGSAAAGPKSRFLNSPMEMTASGAKANVN
jgi:hypothetical protein